MSKPLRILVSGDVEGRFGPLFARINSIQKKAGQFDMLFCIGDFFGDDNTEWEKYKSGENTVPLPTFVLGPNRDDRLSYYPDIDGCELCNNVTYLGKKGLYTESSGLTVAYLSGVDGVFGSKPSTASTCFTGKDVEALHVPLTSDARFKGVDLLLTSPWPKGVAKYATDVDGMDSSSVGSEVIAQVARTLKPRYHFCGQEGSYYERLPYRNHKVLQDSTKHITRFIALAKVGNPQKKKFLYAFNITPMKKMDPVELITQPQDVTECPYRVDSSLLRVRESGGDEAAQYFYDAKALGRGGPGQGGRKRHQDRPGGGAERKKPMATGPCWFCLGSPEVEKHLVVSVGTECYLALAKGGLTPNHILITPIVHHQSTVSAPTEVIQEAETYKAALRKFFKAEDKAVVFFERNYKTQHMQIQAVPLPRDLGAEVKETFMGLALSQDIELAEIPRLSDLKQVVPEGAPYFFAEMPTGEKLFYRIAKGFPLQFGREAMADQSLLNMPQRADWRQCKTSKEEESKMATTFRDAFEKYDFNLA